MNEAHGLSSKVVSRLQTVLEDECVQRNSTWIFTTTLAGQQKLLDSSFDANPFMSRAIEVVLAHGPELELAFALRAREIARKENLDGKPIDQYVRLVRECRCNFRSVLQRVESGEMLN